MCGIFGIVSQHLLQPEWVEQLGMLNTARGNLAFGGLVWSPEITRVFRFAEPFDFSKIDLAGGQLFLGHIRAPTHQQSDDLREVHPFETSSFLLAHNGLLLNHADFPDWRIDSSLEVDSQVIIGGIQNQFDLTKMVVPAITQTISCLEGQQGCWLWSKATPSLYLWRVMSSLYYSQKPGYFIFSSVKCDLANELLPEGLVYRICPNTTTFEAEAKFKFFNPYKMSQ